MNRIEKKYNLIKIIDPSNGNISEEEAVDILKSISSMRVLASYLNLNFIVNSDPESYGDICRLFELSRSTIEYKKEEYLIPPYKNIINSINENFGSHI